MADLETSTWIILSLLILSDFLIAATVPPWYTHRRISQWLSGQRRDSALDSFMQQLERRVTIRTVTLLHENEELLRSSLKKDLKEIMFQGFSSFQKVKAAGRSAEVRNEKKEMREMAKLALASKEETRGFVPILEQFPVGQQDKLIKFLAYTDPKIFQPPGPGAEPVPQEVPLDGGT
jgi:hypothetical protein